MWFQLGKDRDRLLKEHADDRANVRDAGGDDFVARRNAGRRHGDVEGGAAGGTRLHIFVAVNGPVTLAEQSRLLVSFA